jgi:ADP-heptose:LPS heptosyltransferase
MPLLSDLRTILLVFGLRGLGDCVMLLPFLKSIRKAYSEARITSVLSTKHPEFLAEYIDEFIDPLDPIQGRRHWSGRVPGPWDLCVMSLGRNNRVPPTCVQCTDIYSIPIIVGMHQVARFQLALEQLDIPCVEPFPTVTVKVNRNANRIGFNPSSGRTTKCDPRNGRSLADTTNWPPENWSALLHSLPQYEFSLFGTTTVDSSVLEKIRPLIADLPVQYVIDEPIPTVMEKLGQCALFVGADTGLGHLAAAIGIRTIILMIKPAPRFTVYNPYAITINKPEVSVEEVRALCLP